MGMLLSLSKVKSVANCGHHTPNHLFDPTVPSIRGFSQPHSLAAVAIRLPSQRANLHIHLGQRFQDFVKEQANTRVSSSVEV